MHSKLTLDTHRSFKMYKKKVIMMLFKAAEHHRNSEISELFGPIADKRDFAKISLFRRICSKKDKNTLEPYINTKKCLTTVQKKMPFW